MGQLAVIETFTVAEFKKAFRKLVAAYRSLIKAHPDLDQTNG
ncbi:hypothetical protein [Exiguobacterium sp. S22-S28]